MSVEPPDLWDDDTPKEESGDPRAALRCHACGYRLRGTSGEACPECGASVAESQRMHELMHPRYEGTRQLWFSPHYQRANLAFILTPSVVAAAVFGLLSVTGASEFARSAAVLSVLAVVFSPILALLTMPWRGVYEDAGQHGLWWRVVLLATQWVLLLWAAAVVVMRG